jgi:hypothetical protein
MKKRTLAGILMGVGLVLGSANHAHSPLFGFDRLSFWGWVLVHMLALGVFSSGLALWGDPPRTYCSCGCGIVISEDGRRLVTDLTYRSIEKGTAMAASIDLYVAGHEVAAPQPTDAPS